MKTVYLVTKNADFTEGRGPMLPHKIFAEGGVAIRYVEKQSGIFGSPQKITLSKPDQYGSYAHGNGYDIREFTLLERVEDAVAEETAKIRARALDKLSSEEKRVLGLDA